MNLADLHTAIETVLRAGLPGVDVQSYPDLGERVGLPLVVLEVSEFSPADDSGTGELSLEATVQARLVIDPTQPGADIAIRQLAVRLAMLVHQGRSFGLPVTPGRLRQIAPDGFRADLDGYLVWLIEWVHELDIGEPEELDMPVFQPVTVLFSVAPAGVPVPPGDYDAFQVPP
jgi:hypothetical protein